MSFVFSNVKKEERTVETIVDVALEALANYTGIVGERDYGQSLIKLTRYHANTCTFAASLKEIAEHLLQLFPNEPEEVETPEESEG